MKIKGVSVKFLLGNVTMLNMILLMTGVVFLFYLLLPRYRLNVFNTSPVVKIPFTYVKADVKSSMLSISDFTIIGDQNLFHPERKIPTVMEVKADGKPLPMPEYLLYGTLIYDNASIAYMEDTKEPRNTPGRGRRQIALHINDTLSGFTLKEIYTDRVIMVRGSEIMTVSISDTHKKIKTGQIAQKSPIREPVAQSQGIQKSAGSPVQAPAQTSSPKQPQVKKKIEPPLRPIDQDVFNFFEKRKNQ
jgi:hypothetical protein